MTINLTMPTTTQELRPKITVIGVGGAGCNAVNNMIDADLNGVEFLVANTDGQALTHSMAPRKIQLGRDATQGLGAGSKPEIGRRAAEESLEEVMAEIADSNMVFITAGMGGGTGTGAAPVIAQAARDKGILTVGVVTKPFDFEGQRRMTQADDGIKALQAHVDTLIVIPNQNLFRLANERTTFAEAFQMADAVLNQGVSGVTDLMLKPGLINLDFADIRSVMTEMGKAMMGTGEAAGDHRATEAAEAAINNPLLDDTSMRGARAVLINITGGHDMGLFEVDEAANRIKQEVDDDALIIFGSAFDEKLDGTLRVSVVATGIDTAAAADTLPFSGQNTQAHSNLRTPATPQLDLTAAPVIAEMPSMPAVAETHGADSTDEVQADETAEAAETAEADIFADQIDLQDVVSAAEAEAEAETTSTVDAETSEEETDTSTNKADMSADEDTAPILRIEDEAVATMPVFIPAETTDLDGESAMPKTEQSSKSAGLVSRLAGLWAPKAEDTAASKPADTPKAAATPAPFLDLPRVDDTQKSLDVSPSDRTGSASDELEIPAFLRRQAN